MQCINNFCINKIKSETNKLFSVWNGGSANKYWINQTGTREDEVVKLGLFGAALGGKHWMWTTGPRGVGWGLIERGTSFQGTLLLALSSVNMQMKKSFDSTSRAITHFNYLRSSQLSCHHLLNASQQFNDISMPHHREAGTHVFPLLS